MLASKRDTPLKVVILTVFGSCSIKTNGDRYIHAAYHNKHWRLAF